MLQIEQLKTSAPEKGPQTAWFCLRSQPKHEHIAAGFLRKMDGIEVFLPRIRFRRKTRQGVVWATEALFPNYLFANFNWHVSLRHVHHTPGVSGVIHFGSQWPVIPDTTMHELRALFGQQELHIVPSDPAPGDSVQIIGGVFHGLPALVTQTMPARKRVIVLLEFLGRQTTLELPQDSVIIERNAREVVS